MGKLLNNYFYGKAGKADYTTDDLPTTRMQLFREMLRIRLSALVKLNLLYMLIWLPTMVVMLQASISAMSIISYTDDTKAASGEVAQVAVSEEETLEYAYTTTQQSANQLETLIYGTLLFLIPCIAITGPLTAGASYVTRNWSRDEHSFMFSDFKDAVKSNWKQSLPVSVLTGALPFLIWTAWRFYGAYAQTNVLMIVPQVLIVMVGIIWAISVTYMHPLIVGYKLRFRDVLRNAVLMAIGRLPMSVGIRLLHCLPIVLALVCVFVFGSYLPILIVFLYYLIFGFALSRFITASYANSVFDRYINSRIEGAEVGRGLAREDDDDDDDSVDA